jgi:lactoylglutathione lyase
MRVNYAMVFVSDMGRAVAFYRDTLGLPLRFESPNWTEFGTDGATLALHQAGGVGPLSSGPSEPSAGSCRPGFQVTDLDQFHSRMVAHGVPCVQKPKAVFGARVAQYTDPDGLVFSVGEGRKG